MGVAHAPWMRTGPYRHVECVIEPTYKFLPAFWYDVIEVVWETDGTHVPVRKRSTLARRVTHDVARVILKTQGV